MPNRPLTFTDLAARQRLNASHPSQGFDNVDEHNNAFLDVRGSLTFRSSIYGQPQDFSHLHGAARLSAVRAYVAQSAIR